MSKRKTDFRTLRASRDTAMARPELRGPSEPQSSAAGATSFSVKTEDPELSRLVCDYLDRRKGNRL